MLPGRYAGKPILTAAFATLATLTFPGTSPHAQEAAPFDVNGWQLRPHVGLDLNYGTLGTGDTSLNEEGEYDYAPGYGARLGVKLGRFGIEGRYWYSEPDADLPVFNGNLAFVGQFSASTEFELYSVHGSVDVYRSEKFDVYLSVGYGEGEQEFEFDNPAIVEFNGGQADLEAWFGEIGVPIDVANHVQIVPYVQVVAWEALDDGEEVEGTDTLIGSYAGVTVRGIW